MQRTYDAEEAKSIRHHRDFIPKKCSCPKNQIINVRFVENQNLQHVIVSHKTDCQINHADAPDVSQNNSLDHEVQLTSVSFPEDNRQGEIHATPSIGSRKEMEVYKNIEHAVGTETKRNLTSETSEIANATASSTNPTVYSARNDPDKPIASTSKWETVPVSSERLQGNRTASRTPICATAMKFWRKQSAVANKKIIAPMFKRRKSIGRGKLSVIVGTTRDSKMKITQIEPSTVQTAQGGNKRQTYVNIQMQTPDAIVGRILSEFLVSGEKKKRVTMSITLQSDSNNDVSDSKEISLREAETQTSSNDVSSVATDTFDYPYGRPPVAITSTTKTVPCFVCDKRDCYEIKYSDDSITLEDALIAEYPETSELNDYIAKRKTDMSVSP
ncbi:uncharacterized protein [Linepithema humile]|uniref:uncharacterized protein isoform X3 n=1 Tax=Linepithema humile TaxID=83485 RepID=UPI00351F1758